MKNQVMVWIEPKAGQGRKNGLPDLDLLLNRIDERKEERFGEEILRLTLPAGSDAVAGLSGKKKERLRKKLFSKIDRFLEERQCLIVAEDSLEGWVADGRLVGGNALPYLYLRELLFRAAKAAGIPKKDMDILLIDGEGDACPADVDFLVGELSGGINRFSILTDRPLYFEKRIDRVYEETGLPIRLTSSADSGNLAVDLGGFHKKRVRDLKKGAVYLDLNPDGEKVRYILARRRDVAYYNRYMFSLNGEIAENKWIQAVCYRTPDGELERDLSQYGPDPMIRFEGFGAAMQVSGFVSGSGAAKS